MFNGERDAIIGMTLNDL